MTVLGALSTFRKRREMSPHKRANVHKPACAQMVGESETDLLLPPEVGLIGLVLCSKPPAGV